MIDLLQSALDRSPGGFTIDDIRRDVRSGDVTLWRGDGSVAATELVKSFHVWLAAGNTPELMKMLKDAEDRHRAMGIDQVTISDARPGWERVLRPYGYVRRNMLVKEL